jgi:hypothetical protein
MRWPKEERVRYYAQVKTHRGKAAVQDLIGEVKAQWKTARTS